MPKGMCGMLKKTGVLAALTICAALVLLLWSGCRSVEEPVEEVEADVEEALVEQNDQVILEGDGIFVGQIDSQSVEIEIDGRPKAFGLDEGVSVADISDGSKVVFSFHDAADRPILQSIEMIDGADPYLKGEGIYNGRIDSRSVEIEFDGQPKAFALDRKAEVDNLVEGSRVVFTYEEGEYRPLLLSIEVVEAPVGGVDDELKGEGILIGQSDAHSLEIERKRAFGLDKEVTVEDIEDGATVAFTFTETAQGAILDFLEAVDEPLEGEIMHGTLIGQIDSQSVEIEYIQVFAIGQGISIEDIEPGSEISFTYQEGPHRPELTSVTAR